MNVALNRPSYLSSMYTSTAYGAHWASKGNDGDKTKCNGRSYGNSVVITQLESNPWFVVDLGVALHVAGVKLTNRADMAGKPGNDRCRIPSDEVINTDQRFQSERLG